MKRIVISALVLTILFISFLILGLIIISDSSAIDSIDIEVENVRILDLKLESCELKLDIRISNPTTNYISDLIAEFDIFISNTDVGDGLLSEVTIPSESYKTSDVFLTIYYADIGHAVINGLQSGEFEIRISGDAKLNILFNLLTVTKTFSSSYSYN